MTSPRSGGRRSDKEIREKEEDRQVVIRSVTQTDKELVMGLRAQVSDIAAAYKEEPDFVDYSWEQDLTSTTEKLLLAFNGTTFIGMGTLQNLDGSYIEIGVDIVPEYQHQGLGTTLTALLLDYCREHYPDREIRMRARKENTASLRMIEKNGGVFISYEDTPGTVMLEKLLETIPERRAEYAEIIKNGRNGVRVYVLPKECG